MKPQTQPPPLSGQPQLFELLEKDSGSSTKVNNHVPTFKYPPALRELQKQVEEDQ